MRSLTQSEMTYVANTIEKGLSTTRAKDRLRSNFFEGDVGPRVLVQRQGNFTICVLAIQRFDAVALYTGASKRNPKQDPEDSETIGENVAFGRAVHLALRSLSKGFDKPQRRIVRGVSCV